MSDIENRINQWRADLTASETLGTADINELESHLREEISHLQDTGLSDMEALLVARHRLGDPAVLEGEFAKLNTHGRLVSRIRWMAAGILFYLLVTSFCSAASFDLVKFLFEHHLSNIALFGGFVQAIAATAALLFALWLYARLLLPRVAGPISRLILVFSIVALAAGVIALYISQTYFMALIVESLGPLALGAIAPGGLYGHMIWKVLIPILLMGWLAARHLRNSPKANVQR